MSTERAYIGRHMTEDRSLLPKKILLLPENFGPVPEVFRLYVKIIDNYR